MAVTVILAYPKLPSLDVLTDYRPKVPLRVLSSDGKLLGEFGEERRHVVRINEVPKQVTQAILSAEDNGFYEHGGIDYMGVARAALVNITGMGRRQGASTITMQVARNFFLSSEKTMTRKLYEVMLAFKIEHSLSKDEILQLYINQIYLGQRAYGFDSAAQIYFGKSLKNVTLAEAAMLAGLPKAPSSYNPVVNLPRAKLRQQYVLRRMRELGYITTEQETQALAQVLIIKASSNDYGIHAEYVSEMARQIAYDRFKDDAYTGGYQIITTINSSDQEAAYQSLRKGVMDLDRRNGYRGAESYIPDSDANNLDINQTELLEDLLSDTPPVAEIYPAIVLSANPNKVVVYVLGGHVTEFSTDSLRYAASMLKPTAPANKQVRKGAIVRVIKDNTDHWQLSQVPDVQAAFVSASPTDGAVRALVGGFDFSRNQFNHVTQAWRQPGSSFKPFIYSAALEKGFNPATVIDDAPISFPGNDTGGQPWEPKNYDGKYEGPMTMRTALAKSKNMVSIRLLKAIGPEYAQQYITRFGFTASKHPPYLTMALGAGSVTPWQQLAAYSVFANGGYAVTPFVIKQVLDPSGKVIAQFTPKVAGTTAERVIDERNAYVMDSMMHDVTRRGTAARASVILKRQDIAGKTGTTNDSIDAWFCGYHPSLVGVAWMGYDQPKKLGSSETGGSVALPIWIGYMSRALVGVPEKYMAKPDGMTEIEAIDPNTQQPVREYIFGDALPPTDDSKTVSAPTAPAAPSAPATPTVPGTQPAAPIYEAKPTPIKPTTPTGVAPQVVQPKVPTGPSTDTEKRSRSIQSGSAPPEPVKKSATQ